MNNGKDRRDRQLRALASIVAAAIVVGLYKLLFM